MHSIPTRVCPKSQVEHPRPTTLAVVGVVASWPVRRILSDDCSPVAAIHLGRRLPDGSSGPPGGDRTGRPPPVRPGSRWGLPSHPGHPGCWCALTAPFHPYLCPASRAIGGLLSVALSCGSPRLGVTQHRALWSPDVPRTGAARSPARGRLANSLPGQAYDAVPAREAADRRCTREPIHPPSMPSAAAITRCPNT